MKRRDLLKIGAAMIPGLMFPFGRHAWAARSSQTGPRLVVLFLRGAVDGLSVVAPHSEDLYYDYRPTIAIDRPGTSSETLIDLDGHFGLHPALSSLVPLWNARQLGFVHACGSPDPDRSHFEAQAYMETATPGVRTTRSGWINRLAGTLHDEGPASTVAFGTTQPLITRGAAPTATFPNGRGATRMQPMDRDPVRLAFDAIYAGDPRLGRVYDEAIRSRRTLLTALHKDMAQSAQGKGGSEGFALDARRAAHMMVADPKLRLVFFQLGGWDTHVNQGAARGQLADRLRHVGEGLAAFRVALGLAWRETVILVMSEFGRTARENGNRGTDHGHGNVHWVLGGAVAGGRVYGRWDGLNEGALHQGRDLPVTTDFRSIIDLILVAHFAATSVQRREVLPGFQADHKHISGLIV